MFKKFFASFTSLQIPIWPSDSYCWWLTIFLSSTTVPWSTYSMSVAQVTSSFFLFQDIRNCAMPCPMALIDFPSFLSFKMASFFSLRQLSGLHLGLPSLTRNGIFTGLKKAKDFDESTSKENLGKKKHRSATCSFTFAHLKMLWSNTNVDIF